LVDNSAGFEVMVKRRKKWLKIMKSLRIEGARGGAVG